MMTARHHLIVRAEVRRPPTEPAAAIDWLYRLIAAIGMQLAPVPQNPNAYYCPVVSNRGLTATALIETSNITLHTWDETVPGELQLDVFTCADLDPAAVLAAVGEFEPVRIDTLLLDRRGRLALVDTPANPLTGMVCR